MIAAAERQVDAERGLIACILIDTRDAVIQQAVAADVDRAWFTDPRLAHIYQAAFDLYAAGKPVDCVTIGDALKPAGIVDGAELDALMADAVTTQHTGYYVEQLTAHHTRRLMGDTLLRLSSRIESLETGEVADFVATAQEQVCRVGVVERDTRSLADVARAVIADAKKPPEERTGITFPWETWNKLLEPLTDELFYIAARPSVGKTAFALNLAVYAAQCGHRTAFASLESPYEKVTARIVQAMSGVDFRRLWRNPLTTKWADVDAVPDKLESLPLTITQRRMTPESMYAWGKAQVAKGARLLIVDNMKHLAKSERYGSLIEMFRDYSARTKWMRDDLGVPVIMLHHLSHELKLSWSDDIERDADLVAFLLDDDNGESNHYQDKHAPGNDAEIQSVRAEIRKNRDGRTGAIYMELCGETQQFTEEAKPQTATSGGGWGA